MCPGLARPFCGEHKVLGTSFVKRERALRTTREECASRENDERGVGFPEDVEVPTREKDSYVKACIARRCMGSYL